MKKIFIIFAFTVFLTGCSLWQPSPKPIQPNNNTNQPLTNGQNNNGGIACSMEAKLCPDGSAVGRTGPNCEFAPCPSTNGQGIVSGQILLGPTCPVMRIPPDPACADKPYQTTIQIIDRNSPQGAPYKVISSDKQGNYTVTLPVGEYNFQPHGGNVLPRCGSQDVTVSAGANMKVDFSCDTGIR